MLVLGLAVFLALLTVNAALMLVALVPALVLVIGMWQSLPAIQIEAERSFSHTSVRANEPVEVTLTLRNVGQTISELHIAEPLSHRLRIANGHARCAMRLVAGQQVVLTYVISAERGLYQMPTVSATAYDLFGLLTRHQAVAVEGDTLLNITPQFSLVKDVPIRPKNTRAFAGYIPARIPGSGTDFFGVRSYRSGDSLRHINWRAVSRRPDAIFTNEFEQERVADIGLIVDAREQAITFANTTEILEYKISAATAFSETLLGLGNRVSLLVYGSYLNWTLPGYGKRQHQLITQNLTTAAPGRSEAFQSLHHLPTRLFPAKSQIILFSSLLQDDYSSLIRMRARGYTVMIISPNGVLLEAGMLPSRPTVPLARRMAAIDRELNLRKIRQAGIQVVDWDIANPLPDVMRRALPSLQQAVRK